MLEDQAKLKQLAMQWKRAASHLAAARRYDIRHQNTAHCFDALDSICRHAIKTNRPSHTSGLVKMYEILRRSNTGK
jgi:hypothetical protein